MYIRLLLSQMSIIWFLTGLRTSLAPFARHRVFCWAKFTSFGLLQFQLAVTRYLVGPDALHKILHRVTFMSLGLLLG